MLYFPSHKIVIMIIYMPVPYCFMKARGELAQSNNLMETLRDLAHFVSQPYSLSHSQSFRTSLLLLFLPQYLAVGTSWYLALSWFVSFLMSVSTCLFLPFPSLMLICRSSPHLSDCCFLELGIREGISDMVYDFHVTSPVSEKTVPSLGLSVYKGSNEKIHQNLKYCKVLYEL